MCQIQVHLPLLHYVQIDDPKSVDIEDLNVENLCAGQDADLANIEIIFLSPYPC